MDVIDVGADDDPRELFVHLHKDWLQTERKEERAQGVALLLAGDGLERACLVFAANVGRTGPVKLTASK